MRKFCVHIIALFHCNTFITCMDILQTIPEETVQQLNTKNVILLKQDIDNNDSLQLLRIGCELAYDTYKKSMTEPKTDTEFSQARIMLQEYLRKCVFIPLDTYKTVAQNSKNPCMLRILHKRITRLELMKSEIERHLIK